jgi:hypothetical protein
MWTCPALVERDWLNQDHFFELSGACEVEGGMGSVFDVTGPITMSNFGALVVRPAPNQNSGSAIAINNAISVTGTDYVRSYGKQEIDF